MQHSHRSRFRSAHSPRSPRNARGARRLPTSFSNGRAHVRGPSGRGKKPAGVLDESLYIKKAEALAPQEEFKPTYSYEELEVHQILKQNISAKGFSHPTPIQDKTIHTILEGNDVLGIANTGTGKTAAFLIPLIDKVLTVRESRVLILVPTRELADQISDEFISLTKGLNVPSAKCVGGENINRQMQQLRRGVRFLIATPGRLKDLSKRQAVRLSDFDTVVLDEVDRMLDMGFIIDIRFLIQQLPVEKQSLFFSATINTAVEQLMQQILKPGFVKVSVAKGVTAQSINQDVVYFGDNEDKLRKLENILRERENQKVLIFVNTKWGVDKLEKFLKKDGFEAESIHGGKRQNWRRNAIHKFKTDKTNVLIATDVAARGLDIQGVNLVVNYDVPNAHEDYVHRIGRTGRANAFGDALTFIPKKIQNS